MSIDPATGREKSLGMWGEDVACTYLTRTLGWSLLTRNWRCKFGELDVVALTDRELVVVEVKTRSGTAFGSPLESVDPRKRSQLRKITNFFLTQSGHWQWRFEGIPVRIDVVGIWAKQGAVWRIVHIRSAVDG